MKPITTLVLVTVMACALQSCAAVKKVLRTADDIANAACELFGREHPQEFEAHVRKVLPPGAAQQYEADGFNPIVLCTIKEVVQPFIDDVLRQQSGMAASLSQETSGGATP